MESVTLFDLLRRQSVQVTVVAILIWIAVKLIATDRPHLAHALWAIVLLKCVFPPLIASPLGAFCWLSSVPTQQRFIVEPARRSIRLPMDMPKPDAGESKQVVHLQRLSKGIVGGPGHEDRISTSTRSKLPTGFDTSDTGGAIVRLLLWAWCLGAALGLLSTSLKLLRFMRRVKSVTVATPEHVAYLISELQVRLSVRRRICVRVVDSSIGPAVVGLIRPTMLLPKSLVENRSEEQLVPLLAHEMIHIRRGDLLWAFVQTLAVRIWWFHPLVVLAGRRLEREAERSCDEETIGSLNCQPCAYARSLLEILEQKHRLHVAPALPGVRPVDITAKRLERIMRLGQGCRRRGPRWVPLVIVIGISLILPGAAWVVGQDTQVEKEVAQPSVNEDFRLPAATRPLANSAVLPADSMDSSDPTLEQRTSSFVFEVSEALQRICIDERVERAQAQTCLKSLLGGLGRRLDVQFVDDSMRVQCDSTEGKSIQDIVNRIRQHGTTQLCVSLYFATVPQPMFESLDVKWTSMWDGPSRSPMTSSVSVSSPTLMSLVSTESALALREQLQSNTQTSIWQAPKVTVFNGQDVTIQDSSERPFVVSVTELAETGTALQPVIQVASEGLIINLLPALRDVDKMITLDCDICRRRIEDVDTLTFKHTSAMGVSSDASLQAKSVTLQVPRLSSQNLSVKQLQVAMGSTVLLAGLPSESRGEKQVTMAMIQIIPIPKSGASQNESGSADALVDPSADGADFWDLSLASCIHIAIANSPRFKSMVNLPQDGSEVLTIHVGRDELAVHDIGSVEREVARLTEVVANSYWDLYQRYRVLAAAKTGRDEVLAMWRALKTDVHPSLHDAHVREQYFYFRCRTEESKRAFAVAEKNLSLVMGLENRSDRRVIRPVSEPNLESLSAVASGSKTVREHRLRCNTAFAQRAAADTQCAVLRRKVDERTVAVDSLLDAQRRQFDAVKSFFESAVTYYRDVELDARNRGTLLPQYGIVLNE